MRKRSLPSPTFHHRHRTFRRRVPAGPRSGTVDPRSGTADRPERLSRPSMPKAEAGAAASAAAAGDGARVVAPKKPPAPRR